MSSLAIVQKRLQDKTASSIADCFSRVNEINTNKMLQISKEHQLQTVNREHRLFCKDMRFKEHLIDKQKKRLNTERLWTTHFKGDEVALACLKRSRDSDLINDINLRNVGTIVFDRGGYAPSLAELDKKKSRAVLREVQSYKQLAAKTKSRQMTAVSRGNLENAFQQTLPKRHLALDSYIYQGGFVDNIDQTLPQLSRCPSGKHFIPNLLLQSETEESDTILDVDKESTQDSFSRRSFNQKRSQNSKFREGNSKLSANDVIDLLVKGPGLTQSDASLVQQFLSGKFRPNKHDEQNRVTLQRMIESWQIKDQKLKRAVKRGNEEEVAHTHFLETDSDYQFILQLLRNLRLRYYSKCPSPTSQLQCTYLRLNDGKIHELEQCSRVEGRSPHLHAFSKPSEYNTLNIFTNSDKNVDNISVLSCVDWQSTIDEEP